MHGFVKRQCCKNSPGLVDKINFVRLIREEFFHKG